MDDQPQDSSLEPAVFERKPLGRAFLEAHPGCAATRDLEHLRRGVYPPDARLLAERGSEPPRPGADIEHTPAAQVTFADEQLVELPPVLVGGPELVVGRSPAPEIRRRAQTSEMSSSGSVIDSIACWAASIDDSGTSTF